MGDGSSYTDFEPVHNYIENGLFDIQLIASACGWSDTSSQEVLIDLETSIDGAELLGPTVYFDLAQQILILSYPEGMSGKWEWVVSDLNGRVSDKGDLSGRPTNIDLSGFPQGISVFSLLQDGAPVYSVKLPTFR
jgi:PKD repeat protein